MSKAPQPPRWLRRLWPEIEAAGWSIVRHTGHLIVRHTSGATRALPSSPKLQNGYTLDSIMRTLDKCRRQHEELKNGHATRARSRWG